MWRCDKVALWQRYMVTEEPIRLLARLTDTAKATCVRTSVCHASINQCVTHLSISELRIIVSVRQWPKVTLIKIVFFCKQSLKCDDVMICQRLKKLCTVKKRLMLKEKKIICQHCKEKENPIFFKNLILTGKTRRLNVSSIFYFSQGKQTEAKWNVSNKTKGINNSNK